MAEKPLLPIADIRKRMKFELLPMPDQLQLFDTWLDYMHEAGFIRTSDRS